MGGFEHRRWIFFGFAAVDTYWNGFDWETSRVESEGCRVDSLLSARYWVRKCGDL